MNVNNMNRDIKPTTPYVLLDLYFFVTSRFSQMTLEGSGARTIDEVSFKNSKG